MGLLGILMENPARTIIAFDRNSNSNPNPNCDPNTAFESRIKIVGAESEEKKRESFGHTDREQMK